MYAQVQIVLTTLTSFLQRPSSQLPSHPATSSTLVSHHLQAASPASISRATNYTEALLRITSSYHVLQDQYYNATNGLYESTGWWNAANIITTIADLAIVNPSLSPEIENVLSNTFAKAPKSNPTITGRGNEKKLDPVTFLVTPSDDFQHVVSKEKERTVMKDVREGWLNEFYDDEAWWALAWLRAYDLTLNTTYLDAAIYIFEDLRKGNTTPCRGGIWWNKSHTYVNAITNELYLTVAASLANRAGSRKERERHLDIAKKQWRWFVNTGMIGEDWTINDGLNGECENNGGTVWSYNQGVVLGGLSELWLATGDDEYLKIATNIAEAAIKHLTTDKGILKDVCESTGCGADGVQFKGVFLRGLMALDQVISAGGSKANIERFIFKNTESIWLNDRDEKGRIGVVWSGPLREVNAASHGSGLDALVAAADLSSFR